ncbi:MAG: DNA repair protein RadC [Campylobacterales bacterium]|nr:DNA repair protein RadC [Campylobacterales bacterium]
MKKIQELYVKDKPREKLLIKGASGLKDYELLAILLGSGNKEKDVLKLSKEILKKFQDLNLSDPNKLIEVKGIGTAKACIISAALELSKRHLIRTNIVIDSPKVIYTLLSEYKDKKQEYFLVINLDGGNRVISKSVVTKGILNEVIIHPREVFAPAIEARSAAIIIAHNHPSGLNEPSKADIHITKQLQESGKLLGIEVLDHVIFSKTGYFSFKENSMI